MSSKEPANANFAAAKVAVDSERFRRLLLDVALRLLDSGYHNDSDALSAGFRWMLGACVRAGRAGAPYPQDQQAVAQA